VVTSRPFVVVLVLGLGTIAPAAHAQDPEHAAEEAAADEARQRAALLYKQGRSKFELFDFAGALELWSEAYSLVPEGDPDAHAIRSALVHNLSIAHVRAFDVDEDVTHLRTAKMLLTRYIKEADAMDDGSEESTNDLQETRSKLDEIEGKLDELEKAEAEAEAAAAASESQGGGDTSTPAAGADPGVPPPSGRGQTDVVVDKPGKTLVAAGAALLGVGVAGGGLGLAGAFMGSSAEQRAIDDAAENRPGHLQDGRTANTLAYVGSAVGGTLLITGVAVLAAGLAKNKKASTAARLRVLPLVGQTNGVRISF
jgi:tetratricopeptide (TPR) repeat protein